MISKRGLLFGLGWLGDAQEDVRTGRGGGSRWGGEKQKVSGVVPEGSHKDSPPSLSRLSSRAG